MKKIEESELRITGTQMDILTELTAKPQTRQALADKFNLSVNTIRGRISELNSLGFEIVFEKPSKKYKLSMTSKPYTKLVLVDQRPYLRKNQKN